jgi:hypothetical protein
MFSIQHRRTTLLFASMLSPSFINHHCDLQLPFGLILQFSPCPSETRKNLFCAFPRAYCAGHQGGDNGPSRNEVHVVLSAIHE